MTTVRITAVVTMTMTLGACTRWSVDNATPTLGPPIEVSRRLVGSPMVEERTEIAVGGVAGGARTNNAAVGAVSGGAASVKRTHCVQQAQVDYSQDVELTASTRGRGVDLGIGIPVAAVGLLVASSAYSTYQNDTADFQAGFISSRPVEPTGSYIGGSVMAVAGGALILYSVLFLPKGPRPVIPTQKKTWSETIYVEAQGCGLVPGDVPAPAAPPAPVTP